MDKQKVILTLVVHTELKKKFTLKQLEDKGAEVECIDTLTEDIEEVLEKHCKGHKIHFDILYEES